MDQQHFHTYDGQAVSKYYQMSTGVRGDDSQLGTSGLARASLNTLRLIS